MSFKLHVQNLSNHQQNKLLFLDVKIHVQVQAYFYLFHLLDVLSQGALYLSVKYRRIPLRPENSLVNECVH